MKPGICARLLPASMGAALWLGGCANLPDGQRTQAEGAAAGALGGAVIGQVLGGSTESTAIGAALGGALGYAIGRSVAKEKSQFAASEDALRQVIAEAQASTEESRRVNAELSRQIEALNAQARQLQSRRLSQQARQAQLAQQRQQSRQLLAQTRTVIARLDQQLARQRRDINANASNAPPELVNVAMQRVSDLDGERLALEAARLRLEQIDARRAY